MPDQNEPFPIQAEGKPRDSTIPWWLAEVAYIEYSRRFGNSQSLEQLAKRGGFGSEELLILLKCSEFQI